jgi:hypothetical protein
MSTQGKFLSILKAKSSITKPQQGFLFGWKKILGVIVIVGTITVGISGTAQAAMPGTENGLCEGVSAEEPQVGQSVPVAANNKYLSTNIQRDRSSGLSSTISGTMTAAAATRCPFFRSWEDWPGGARVHAYVDFRPSDWCNGRHVKRAYVRLIRQCGPYYDTGRIYTYTAGSASDTRLYSVSAWIYDSPLWGCTTRTYYGYDYF